MPFVIENQIALIAGCFALGILGTFWLFRSGASARAWKIADLLWVVLGGLGAVTAVVAGIYRADTTRIERQIDVAFALSRAFEHEAAQFRLLYCEDASAVVRVLCDKVEFLSASEAINRNLPLFLDVARIETPLRRLRIFLGARGDEGMDEMMKQVDDFDAGQFLAFAARNEATKAADAELRSDAAGRRIAVEFQLIAKDYETMIGQIGTLKTDWEFLRANSQFLIAQILALCLVAFAAPFRVGKSVIELT